MRIQPLQREAVRQTQSCTDVWRTLFHHFRIGQLIMKKILSIILAVLMVCSHSVSAGAEKKTGPRLKGEKSKLTTTEFNLKEFEKNIKDPEINGRFELIDEVGLKFWLPESFKEIKLTEKDREDGFIKYYSTEDEASVISVSYYDANIRILEELKAELEKEADAANVKTVLVNGRYAVYYDVIFDDIFCLDFSVDSGYVLEFTFYPLYDQHFQESTAAAIVSSIQPID